MAKRLMIVEDEAIPADEVSGVEAADRIQDELDIPVVFLTAMEERTLDTDAAGSSRTVIPKPYEPAALRDAIAALLD